MKCDRRRCERSAVFELTTSRGVERLCAACCESTKKALCWNGVDHARSPVRRGETTVIESPPDCARFEAGRVSIVVEGGIDEIDRRACEAYARALGEFLSRSRP